MGDAGGSGFLVVIGRVAQGAFAILKETVKETIGHLVTGKFWWNLAKRIGKVAVVTASETAFSAMSQAFVEAKGKVRKAVGIEENDPVLRGIIAESNPQPSSPFSRPYTPTSQVPVRTYTPTPTYRDPYPAAPHPATMPADKPFPGF